MKRRQFLAVCGGAATWAWAAHGQQRIAKIGMLWPGAAYPAPLAYLPLRSRCANWGSSKATIFQLTYGTHARARNNFPNSPRNWFEQTSMQLQHSVISLQDSCMSRRKLFLSLPLAMTSLQPAWSTLCHILAVTPLD